MVDEQVLKLFSRLKQNQDGLDLLKFLEDMSKRNYEEFKVAPTEMNDIIKGSARTLDFLITLFQTCGERSFEKNNIEILDPHF